MPLLNGAFMWKLLIARCVLHCVSSSGIINVHSKQKNVCHSASSGRKDLMGKPMQQNLSTPIKQLSKRWLLGSLRKTTQSSTSDKRKKALVLRASEVRSYWAQLQLPYESSKAVLDLNRRTGHQKSLQQWWQIINADIQRMTDPMQSA